MRKNTELQYGQLREIAKRAGKSYTYVRKVLVYGVRHNDKILEISKIIVDNNKELDKKLKAA